MDLASALQTSCSLQPARTEKNMGQPVNWGTPDDIGDPQAPADQLMHGLAASGRPDPAWRDYFNERLEQRASTDEIEPMQLGLQS